MLRAAGWDVCDMSNANIHAATAATFGLDRNEALKATTNIERVFIQGREVDLSNRQTKLNEKYREKYRRQAIAK